MLLTQNIHLIIKLQAWIRGCRARRMLGMLRAKQLGSSKYFTQEEARETVTKRLYNQNQPREQRPLYRFKTGAVYTG